MTLRQRINHELENFHSGVEYHIMSPEQFTMALDAYTDRILAEVREALLSNQVQAPIRHELHHYPRTSTRGTVKTVIEMALDAVATTNEGR